MLACRHFVEIHPDVAAEPDLSDSVPVRLLSGYGAVIAQVAYNDRIPRGAAFINYLVGQGISSDLADGHIGLGVLDGTRDADALRAIRAKSNKVDFNFKLREFAR